MAKLSRQRAFLESARKKLQRDDKFKGWICFTDTWPSTGHPQAVALKLLKTHWANDVRAKINFSGIFFSIWADEIDSGFLRYNIHAFKLRQLRGYRLESRKFAVAFREALIGKSAGWPNLSTDFGPQTLMEGFEQVPLESCEDTTLDWCGRFIPLANVIDELLAQAQVISGTV